MISNSNYNFLGACRDAQGNVRVHPFLASDKNAMAELAKVEFQPKEESAALPSILDDVHIKALRPSLKPVNQKTSLLYKLIALCQRILHLIRQLWSTAPTSCDQRLMATLLGDRTLAACPGLEHAPLSVVLKYTIQFLDQEPSAPKDLLTAFKQCASWADSIEKIEETNPEQRNESLQGLRQKVHTTLQKLSPGHTCLVPGAALGPGHSQAALYEIQRTQDLAWHIRLITHDPSISGVEPLPCAGKLKIPTQSVFVTKDLAELAAPKWKAPWTPFTNYRTATKSTSQIKNIGVLIDEKLNPLQRKSAPAQRRKLRLKLGALFEFFEAVRPELAHNKTNRFLIRQGVENISRLVSLMYTKGQVSEQDIASILQELTIIEQGYTATEPSGVKKSSTTVSGKPYYFPKLTSQLNPLIINPSVMAPMPVEERSKASPFPEELSSQVFTCSTTLEPLKAETAVQQLKQWREECKQLFEQGEYFRVQEHVMDLFGSLEFDPIEYVDQSNIIINKDKNDDFWKLLSSPMRSQCSREIQELSQQLADASVKTGSLLPDRFILLLKATYILDWLARLNKDETQLTEENLFLAFGDFFKSVIPATVPWQTNDGMRRMDGITPLKNSLAQYYGFRLSRYHAIPGSGDYTQQVFNRGTLAGFIQRFLPGQIPAQIQDLQSQLNTMYKFIPVDESLYPEGGSDRFFRRQKSETVNQKPIQEFQSGTSRHFESTFLRAAAFYGRMGQGCSMNYARALDKDKETPFTSDDIKTAEGYHLSQENIVYDPQKMLKLSKSHNVVFTPKHEKDVMPDIQKEDLADLMFLLDPGMALWEVMGLIREKSYLLDQGDVRAYLEHLLLGESQFWYQNASTEGHPPELSVFANWLEEEVKRQRQMGKISTVLFLIHINQRLKQELLQTPNSKEIAAAFQDFTPLLKEWSDLSVNPQHPYFKHSHLIRTLYLTTFDKSKQLNAGEIFDLFVCHTRLKQSPQDPVERDPLKEDSVNRLVHRWKKPLQEIIDRSAPFRQALLDAICRAQKCPLPKDSWEGTFPVYKAGAYEIDVVQGSIRNTLSGAYLGALPHDIMHAPLTHAAFPKDTLGMLSFEKHVSADLTHYLFNDTLKQQNCITQSANGLDIHKNIAVGGQSRWVQFVANEEILPPRKLAYPDWSKGLKYNLRLISQLLTKQSKDSLPLFLYNPDYRFWVDPQNADTVFVLTAKGEIQFQLHFSHSSRGRSLASMKDLRSGDASEPMQASILDVHAQPAWKLLTLIEDPRHIIVWSKEGQIQSVELPRLGLRFKEDAGKILCTNPGLENWSLDPHSAGTAAKKGIPHALLLTHPTDPHQRRALVPHLPLAAKKFRPSFSWGLLLTSLKSAITKRQPAVVDPDPLHSLFKFDRKAFQQDYLLFQIDPHTAEWQKPAAQKGVAASLYFGRVALASQNFQSALEFLLQAKKSVSECLERQDKKELEAILDMPANGPDMLAIKLQTAFFLNEKGSIEAKDSHEKQLVAMYKNYVACAHHVDTTLKPSLEQEVKSLKLLESYDPRFYRAHAPLLATVGVSEKRAMKAYFSSNTVKPIAKPNCKTALCCEAAFEGLKKKSNVELSNLELSTKCHLLADHFFDLYRLAEEGDTKAPAFKNLVSQLQTIKLIETEYLPLLKYYLELVVEVRRDGAFMGLLPAVPTFDAAKTTPQSIAEFIQKLETFVDSYEEHRDHLIDRVALKQMEADLEQALAQVEAEKPGVSLDQLSLDELQNKLPAKTEQHASLSLLKVSGGALYTSDELKDYFIPNPNKQAPIVPNLSVLKNHSSPAVKQAVVDVESDLTVAVDEMAKESPMLIKDEAARAKLESLITARKSTIESDAVKIKLRIEALLQPKATTLQALHCKGKLVKSVEWDRFVKHFLQQDLASLKPHLPPETDFSQLEQSMRAYLIVATQQQRLEAALDDLQKMQSGKENINSLGSETVYHILSAERQYDPHEYQHLLCFEYLMGFLLRGSQLSMVQDFVSDPDCVRQAITGAGKTTVILLLTALLKANGANLVTLIFPKPLFETNLAYFQAKLGKTFQQCVYPLRYQIQMSHVHMKKTQKGIVKESIFKEMYEQITRTILKRGLWLRLWKVSKLLSKNGCGSLIRWRLQILPRSTP